MLKGLDMESRKSVFKNHLIAGKASRGLTLLSILN